MTAKAELAMMHLKSVLQVPIGAIYEKDGQAVVFTRNDFPTRFLLNNALG
ncbi:MAG: hypothetical protein GWP06_10510 [Actinobacteria bacterium]|nr:hypothetical protein [Actinomycetota bacterium]